MPLIEPGDYKPPWGWANPHLQTVWGAVGRRVSPLSWTRLRVVMPEGDSLAVDYLRVGTGERVAVICPGMEADSHSRHRLGMSHALIQAGWSVAALLYRGCDGSPPEHARGYHAGATDDLALVLARLHDVFPGARTWALVGLSLGGNLVLKYASEWPGAGWPAIAAVAAVSAPTDLAGSAACLNQRKNRIYQRRFMVSLQLKLLQKVRAGWVDLPESTVAGLTSVMAFDDCYTGRWHGFTDAQDYWSQSSANRFLGSLASPAYLLNAADDPFLSEACYPRAVARDSASFTLEIPDHGGHLGFVDHGRRASPWYEPRLVSWLNNL